MMYEYPLMEGDDESFLNDVEMHDLCIGVDDSDYDSDDDYTTWRLVPPQKQTCSQGCQTDPWEPSQAPAEVKNGRLRTVTIGKQPANPEIRPSPVNW